MDLSELLATPVTWRDLIVVAIAVFLGVHSGLWGAANDAGKRLAQRITRRSNERH